MVEDLHWADDGLVEFIAHLVEWSRRSPILLVTLARPEVHGAMARLRGRRRNVSGLHLAPLDTPTMRTLVAGTLPGVPDEVVAAIGAPGGRRPALRGRDGPDARGGWDGRGHRDRGIGLTRSVAEGADPETLHALIGARVDALTAGDRELLQHGVGAGPEAFTVAALAAVSGRRAAELERRGGG